MDERTRALALWRQVILGLLAVGCVLFEVTALSQVWSHSLLADAVLFSYSREAPRATVESVGPDAPGAPNPVRTAGLRAGDVVLEIENSRGQRFPIAGLFDHDDALRSIHFGEPWRMLVVRDGVLWLDVPPTPDPKPEIADFLIFGAAYVLLPLLALAAGLLVGFARPADDQAFLAALLFLTFPTQFSVYEGGPAAVRLVVLVLRYLSVGFNGYLVFRFFLRFPSPSPLDRRAPWLNRVLFWLTVLATAWPLVKGLSVRWSFELAWRIRQVLAPLALDDVLTVIVRVVPLVALGLGLLSLGLNVLRPGSLAERRRLVLILSGASITFLPLGTYIALITLFNVQALWLTFVVAATLWVFPASFVYAVLKHQVFGIRVILRRLQYGAISRGFAVLGLAAFIALDLVLEPVVAHWGPHFGLGVASLGSAGVALLLASGLRRVNRRVQPSIDRAFYREAYDARQILTSLGEGMRELAADPERILQVVARELHRALHPVQVAIWLRVDEACALLAPARTDGGAPLPELALDGCAADTFCCALLAPAPGAGAEARFETITAAPPEIEDLLRRTASGGPDTFVLRPGDEAGADGGESGAPETLAPVRIILRLKADRGLLGFITLGDKLSEEPYSRDDRELLLSVANQASIALDYARLIGQAAERERVRRELELAQEVQAQLFPQHRPPMRTLDYTGVSQAARTLGGDYFDFVDLGPGRLGIALADISGKGLSAALLMASLQGALRSRAAAKDGRVAELVGELNAQVCASSASNRFATLFYAVYDDERRTLAYVNAGHNPPFVVRSGGDEDPGAGAATHAATAAAAVAGRARVVRLARGGVVLGVVPGESYDADEVRLQPGDLFVAYSDGVTDAENADGEPFGEERLSTLVVEHARLAPAALRDLILSALSRHAGSVPFGDDVTLVVARAR